MESVETSGKTVEEAVEKALAQLGLDRSQVDVEIVNEGRPRIFGFGGEPARVIVHPLPAAAAPPPAPPRSRPPAGGVPAREPVASPPEDSDDRPPPVEDGAAVPVAVELLEEMLKRLHVDATVASRPPATPGDGLGMVIAVLDVQGDDLGMLIGRRGETLVSLQYMLNLMLARRTATRVMVGVDVGGYRRRREESLRSLAMRTADRVRASGQSVTLEPMPPNERRIIHIALSDNPDVLTVSIGEGEGRKVAITPRH